MFIFDKKRLGKGWCAITARPSLAQTVAAVGFAASMASANILAPTHISLHENGAPTSSVSGVFNSNIGLNEITLGEKSFQLKGKDFHSPVSVKLFAQSRQDAKKFDEVPDSDIGGLNGAFQFALSEDVNQAPGMTALDVARSSDFGRMVSPTGNRTTRTQVFLSLPERDNNPLANDQTPELILMGAVPNGTLKITPILAGNSDIPESLIFGRTIEVSPSEMASARTGLSIKHQGATNPLRMCVVGLDLSGDLKVEAEHAVVGYQLECPAGTTTAVKMIAVGSQESIVYASDSPALEMIELGSSEESLDSTFMVYAQAASPTTSSLSSSAGIFGKDPLPLEDNALIIPAIIEPIFKVEQNGINGPLAEPGYNYPSAKSTQRQSYDGGSNLPPPPNVVPAPGALALAGIATRFISRRRNNRASK